MRCQLGAMWCQDYEMLKKEEKGASGLSITTSALLANFSASAARLCSPSHLHSQLHP
jgi:hypothetical protein